MNKTLIFGAVAALLIGLVLFAKSSKNREANGEWSNSLQWGYLLMMVGVFGILSAFMSFTAVLLVFVLITGVIWFVHKGRLKKQAEHHGAANHFTDYLGGFFPIILAVFVLRTFVAELFQIPSSSMRPGLVVGGSMTAAANTLPAKGPRPASSTPAIRGVVMAGFLVFRRPQAVIGLYAGPAGALRACQ